MQEMNLTAYNCAKFRLNSVRFENMMLTHCQDYILTENIRFVWSKRSYCGDFISERGNVDMQDDNRRTSEDRATQPMDAGGIVSQCLQIDAHLFVFIVNSKLWSQLGNAGVHQTMIFRA